MNKTELFLQKLKDKVNGKFYIGSSVDIKNRWKLHLSELNKNYEREGF